MTDLSLLYGAEDNMSSNHNDNSDNMYSSQISGQQLHKLALQNDMNNDNYSQNNQHPQQHPQQHLSVYIMLVEYCLYNSHNSH